MKVKHIERLLRTEIHHYEAKDEVMPKRRRLMRAADAVSVPEHLQDFVSFLSVNTHPLGLRAQVATSSATTEANGIVADTLASIRQTYGIPDDLVATNPTNAQCVPSFYDEAYNLDDLQTFYEQYLPGESPPKIIEKGDRVNRPERASAEASLDLQYITGVGRNATTYIWTMNGSNPYSSEDEPFVEFAQDVLELENPRMLSPLVIQTTKSTFSTSRRATHEHSTHFLSRWVFVELRCLSLVVMTA